MNGGVKGNRLKLTPSAEGGHKVEFQNLEYDLQGIAPVDLRITQTGGSTAEISFSLLPMPENPKIVWKFVGKLSPAETRLAIGIDDQIIEDILPQRSLNFVPAACK